jgi:hypothetical protein
MQDGWTPLFVAAEFGSAEVASVLLVQEATVDAQSKVCTCYHYQHIDAAWQAYCVSGTRP